MSDNMCMINEGVHKSVFVLGPTMLKFTLWQCDQGQCQPPQLQILLKQKQVSSVEQHLVRNLRSTMHYSQSYWDVDLLMWNTK